MYEQNDSVIHVLSMITLGYIMLLFGMVKWSSITTLIICLYVVGVYKRQRTCWTWCSNRDSCNKHKSKDQCTSSNIRAQTLVIRPYCTHIASYLQASPLRNFFISVLPWTFGKLNLPNQVKPLLYLDSIGFLFVWVLRMVDILWIKNCPMPICGSVLTGLIMLNIGIRLYPTENSL